MDCKFFEFGEELDKSQPNCIVIQKKDSDFQQLIVMNSKECQLFMDKSNPDASWNLMCDSIEHRSGIAIMDGNWDLVASCINGHRRPLH
jgi:hypothetical protein